VKEKTGQRIVEEEREEKRITRKRDRRMNRLIMKSK
jgi:hypothetical protein